MQPMSQDADRHAIRRVILPSGKAIEVLYFAGSDRGDEPAGLIHEHGGLHRCPACDSTLVNPIAWEEAGPEHWDVTLHCPNCDWVGGGVYSQELVERLDEELDRGTEALVRDVQRLMRANMEDEIDRFAAALAADQIWPMDF